MADFMMIVLAILVYSGDVKDFRVDVTQPSGAFETYLVKKSGKGYLLLSVRNGNPSEVGWIQAVKGRKDAYVLKRMSLRDETFDLGAGLKGFDPEAFRDRTEILLRTRDDTLIRVAREGHRVTILSEKSGVRYICH